MQAAGESLVFRAGCAADEAQIEQMTKDIWGGEDYLAKVWRAWVAEPRGRLQVGLLGEEIVAVGRIRELTPGGWWLEGLRVNPAYQGKGLATTLHNHLVALALQQPGVTSIGLSTHSENAKVAHLAERSGMALHGRYQFLKAEGLAEAVAGVEGPLPAAVPELLARLRASRWLALTGGYAMEGWVARPLDEAWLDEVVASGGVWACGEAMALMGIGANARQFWLYLLDGGSEAERVALVRHARHRSHHPNLDSYVRCFVPMDEALARPLLDGGMRDADDEPFYMLHFVRRVESKESTLP